MNYLYEPSKISLTYGSIISFCFDNSQEFNSKKVPSLRDSLIKSIKKDNINNNKDNEEFADILLSREFLYSQGVFNEYCFFHKFKDKNELKYNYYNSLF